MNPAGSIFIDIDEATPSPFGYYREQGHGSLEFEARLVPGGAYAAVLLQRGSSGSMCCCC